MNTTGKTSGKRPRYVRVREKLIERVRAGGCAPGALIPSEFEIAREFGVSQGTARLAVSSLADENVVARRQGFGTFVYQHTPEDELARFSCLFDAGHTRLNAESDAASPVRASADRTERSELRLGKGAKVLRISRVRTHRGRPFVLEAISLPEALFPGFADRDEVPNALYEVYQKEYGVLVVKADEQITAVAANRPTAKALGIVAGMPLLKIARVAFALDDSPVERRVSLCHLAEAYYLAHLK